jgi:hypothetical protein
MSRGPARRASFKASRYSTWRWRRPMDCEPAEPRSVVFRGAWRTPERPGRWSGAETPESAGFRSASRSGLPTRKPRFSSAPKTGSSRPPKAQTDARCGPKTGGARRRGPLKTRRRRTAAGAAGGFRSVSDPGCRFKARRQSFQVSEARSPAL